MKGWTISLSKVAQRDFRQLEDGPQREAAELIADLAEDPALVPAIELRANPNIWRVRFHNNHRMIYRVAKAEKRVIVTRIRPRSIAYKGMKH